MHVPPSSASRVPQSIIKGSVAPEIRVQPPTVKGTVQPSSTPQPSNAVRSRVPQSTVSGGVHPSESKRPDTPSQTIVRDFASQKPGDSSRTAIRDVSTKPESTSKGTQLLRDGAPIAKGTQLLRDASLKPGTQLLRDDATTTQGTQLLRDASLKPGTRLIKDGPPAESKLPSKLAGASKYVASRAIGGTVLKPVTPSFAKSFLENDDNKIYASRQSMYKSLRPDEQEKQDKWAEKLMKKNGPCPQGYPWERRNTNGGGYQCGGGGHLITDALLSEGKLGIYASKQHSWDDTSTWDGPYFKDPNRGNEWFRA